MKIEIKTTSGSILFTHESEENTVRITISEALKSGADLSDANLWKADLSDANLSGADLRNANLWYADLRRADLRNANLCGADLDFSCLSFSCKSRIVNTDRKQRVQLCHHLLSWMKYTDNLADDEKEIFSHLIKYANEFHRTDVEKF